MLVIDNHDSFVHTLVDYLGELGAATELVEADAVADASASIRGFDGVLISPGPGTPQRAGASIEVVHAAAAFGTPLLGVCLGHQAIAAAFGADVIEAPELMHGMTSLVHHDGRGLYEGMPEPFVATRYHSLAIRRGSVPPVLGVTSQTDVGTIMGVRHRDYAIEGVQFHPESVLTEGGYRLLGNWLTQVGAVDAAIRGARLHPRR